MLSRCAGKKKIHKIFIDGISRLSTFCHCGTQARKGGAVITRAGGHRQQQNHCQKFKSFPHSIKHICLHLVPCWRAFPSYCPDSNEGKISLKGTQMVIKIDSFNMFFKTKTFWLGMGFHNISYLLNACANICRLYYFF